MPPYLHCRLRFSNRPRSARLASHPVHVRPVYEPHQLFPTTACSISLPMLRSVTSLRNSVLSFRHIIAFAWLTCIQPYFAKHRRSCASIAPFPHHIFGFAPALIGFSARIMGSSCACSSTSPPLSFIRKPYLEFLGNRGVVTLDRLHSQSQARCQLIRSRCW